MVWHGSSQDVEASVGGNTEREVFVEVADPEMGLSLSWQELEGEEHDAQGRLLLARHFHRN